MMLQVIADGLIVGSVISLGAIGLTITLSILRFSNFGHGELLAWGAYIALSALAWFAAAGGTEASRFAPFSFGWPLVFALLVAMAGTAALALALDWALFTRLRSQGAITLVIASFGAALATRNLLFYFYGGIPQYYSADLQIAVALLPRSVLGGLRVTPDQLFVLALTVVTVTGLHLFMSRSTLGRAMRATSHNPQLARISGIDPERVMRATWVIGAMLAALAGVQEYANDVVGAIQQICDEGKVPHPIIVSESGRALTAHHAVLLFEVVGVGRQENGEVPATVPAEAPSPVRALHEVYLGINRKNFQEAFHDLMQLREEVATLFNYGHVTLRWRALAERIAWATFRKIQPFVRELEYVPDELAGLEKDMADTYYCNFSTFQSLPDAWAVDQLFPIIPVHRLHEEPRRRAILADITCDSDGKIDRFIDLRDVKEVLELHDVKPGDDYVVGVFLVGAYQEILGDLHNLFGDINAVHISVAGEGSYNLEHVVEGDTVSEVLRYVEMSPEDLTQRFRRAAEEGVRQGRLSLQESKQLLGLYKSGLDGYTYLEN